MADIEKVLNGFRHCFPETEEDESLNCDDCPYEESCSASSADEVSMPTCIFEDVYKLLKEQDKATEEEKEYYKEEYGEYNEGDADELEMIENVPGDGEEVLLWTGYGFTVDTYDDGMFEGAGEVEKGMAWRYLPKPPKEDETH